MPSLLHILGVSSGAFIGVILGQMLIFATNYKELRETKEKMMLLEIENIKLECKLLIIKKCTEPTNNTTTPTNQ